MKWSIPLLALVSVVCGITAAHYFLENRQLRQEIEILGETAARSAVPASVAPVAAPEPALESEIVEGPERRAEGGRRGDWRQETAAEDGGQPALPEARRGPPRGGQWGEWMTLALTDPEMREAVVQRTKTELDREYASLFRHLGLDEVELEVLRTILAEEQLTRLERRMLAAGGENGLSWQDATQWAEGRRENLHRELAAILGPDVANRVSNYQATLPQRREVSTLARRLDYTGAPLQPRQEEALVRTLAAAQAEVPLSQDLSSSVWRPRTNYTQADVETFLAERQQRDALVLQQSRSFLDDRQLDLLADQQIQDLEQVERQLRFRLRAESGD
ncbi:MAG: hypothetical protein EA425_13420 [Puniceicoccaceae bacterium]|nr:MAG: hypothetical protein EA425_13420 [Puniceicoccaceae bacterium]